MSDAADRTRPRRDVASLQSQGSYIAKRCPLRVQYDFAPPEGFEPAPDSPAARAQMDDGIAFEADVFAEITRDCIDVLEIGGDIRSDERRQRTAEAMDVGAFAILGGELQVDDNGRRVGKPDILVRAERRPDNTWAYHPVDVKHHLTLDATTDDKATPTSSLALLAFDHAGVDGPWAAKRNRGDLLQLAHYRRMLEAADHASVNQMAGVVGKERKVTWYDLGAPVFRERWLGHKRPTLSALELYDIEFAFRLDVLAAAIAGESIVEPVYITDCPDCPWRVKCVPELETSDSVSLLPGYGYLEWHIHGSHGITTRQQLAALDRRSAGLRDDFKAGDLRALVEQAAAVDARTPIADLVGSRSRKKIETLEHHAVRTAGDLAQLDGQVLATVGRPVGTLSEVIDLARVATHGLGRPHRRRGVEAVVVPSADVEIDIDMENALDGTVYLWGAFDGSRYDPTVSWDPASEAVEAEVFAAFWDKVDALRRDARRAGRSVLFYCWNQTAEIQALRNGARRAVEVLGRATAPDDVETFVASGELVDLMRVFKEQVITGGGAGLKEIAPFAGFKWRAEDAGGDLAMLWHRESTESTDPSIQATSRERLLTYNEDDVRATSVIRSWLRETSLPSIAQLDALLATKGA